MNPELTLYWIQGCANCTRLKGYLSARGVDYTAVNVMDDVAAVEEMRRLGIASLPVVRVGDRWVTGIDLARVDELLELEPDADHRLLPVAALGERAVRMITLSARLARQLSPDHYADPTPTLDRFQQEFFTRSDGSAYIPHGTSKTLVDHIAGHAQKYTRFLLAADGTQDLGFEIALKGDDLAFGEPDRATPVEHVAAGLDSAASTIGLWLDANPNPDLSRPVDTYYGLQSLHQLVQTHTCSLLQHTRQLADVVERSGVAPDGRVVPDDLDGLLMPAGIWQ